jgi:hypothetical protein
MKIKIEDYVVSFINLHLKLWCFIIY